MTLQCAARLMGRNARTDEYSLPHDLEPGSRQAARLILSLSSGPDPECVAGPLIDPDVM
jgi:hypothetical protein